MLEVSVRDLKNHLSEHLRRLEQGEAITVTRRGKPIAVILPPDGEPRRAQELQRKLLALKASGFLVQVGDARPKGLKPRVRLIGQGPTVSEIVLGDRGDPLP
jgi:prevent-host-death family protein